ncbi:MAG: hypothetical protein K2R98_20210 [Gemmataceae bacterium]|nr:hypothetical protein [Gemmataceae bacterium]
MLCTVQRLLLDALLSDDPPAALRRQLASADELSDQERAWLERIDPDGLILTSLLVKKLRFERLTRSDVDMNELFERAPEEFMRLFQAYAAAVPPTVYFPGEEANKYRQWEAQAFGGENAVRRPPNARSAT